MQAPIFFDKIISMESFKANLIIFIIIASMAFLGYWAVGGLKAATDSLVSNTNTTEDVVPIPVSNIEEEKKDAPVVEESESPEEVEVSSSSGVTGEYANLILDLEDLIDDNVLMKKGSRGTRVGTVQEFLVEYGINMSVDNDYGDATVNAVREFQREQGLSADGQTGPNTYRKMIDWLKQN